MHWRSLTIVILVSVAFALAVWDVIAAAMGGNRATISRVLVDAAKAHPVIPFAIGVLMGHLFASQQGQ